ncbi:MAG: choice-of-anchor X domain-containing protein [Myxococcota bacterium]
MPNIHRARVCVLLLAWLCPALAGAAITNPSFEDDGSVFLFHTVPPTAPIGWSYDTVSVIKGRISDFYETDGSYIAQLYIPVSGVSAPPAGPTRLTQAVDLTGVDTITFDAVLSPEVGWNPLVVASFWVDGAMRWSSTTGGFLYDQAVDVSGVSGVVDIEFQLDTSDSGAGTGGHAFFFDHLRETAPPPRLTSTRVDPLVLVAGVDTGTMTVTCSDPPVSEIHIDLGPQVTQGGVAANTTVFRDDGTQGDATAGDGVFTADDLALAATPDTVGYWNLGSRDVDYLFPSAPTHAANEDLALAFRYIQPSVPIPSVTDHAADVRASDYAVSMDRPLLEAFPSHRIDTQDLAIRYYELFPDDLDFFLIAHEYGSSLAAGSFSLIRNDVVGTGQPIQDRSGEWGSNGVLRGYASVYTGFTPAFWLWNHELLHYWAAHLDASLELNTNHWEAVVRPSTGFGASGPNLVYDRIESLGGNAYRGVDYPDATQGAFNDLELYLMGLEPDNAVADPIETLTNPVYTGQGAQVCDPVCGDTYEFTADSLTTVSMADITTANGARSPAYPASPTAFEAKLVVAYDRVLTDTELAYYDWAMREYEKASSSHDLTFAAATGNRAVLTLPEPGAAAGLLSGVLSLALLRRRTRTAAGR